jgi:hypothetical protein
MTIFYETLALRRPGKRPAGMNRRIERLLKKEVLRWYFRRARLVASEIRSDT